MRIFFFTFIICTMTASTLAADRYYSNKADEVRGKIEYNLLQREINQTAAKDQKRRKQLNAREGSIVLTNEEIDQRLDLLGRFITHPESKRAIDFVNNAEVDPYKATEQDELNVEGFSKMDNEPQEGFIHPENKNGERVDFNELFPLDLSRQGD